MSLIDVHYVSIHVCSDDSLAHQDNISGLYKYYGYKSTASNVNKTEQWIVTQAGKQQGKILCLTDKNIPKVLMTNGMSQLTCSLVLKALAVFCSESVTGCDLADKEP